MHRQLQGMIIGLALGGLLVGGVAFAVTAVPPNSTDRYYACVSVLGRVRQDTVRFDSPPASCPKPADTVRSWNAQGPQGVPGPAGPPGDPDLVVLTVNVIGLGTVSGPGIECGLDCSEPLVRGEVRGLQASAATGAGDNGSVFVGWSGGCGGTGACSLHMDGDKSVTATFAPLAISGTLSGNRGAWSAVFTNDSNAPRDGLSAHINSLAAAANGRGPLDIPTMTTSRGTLKITPYQPGWTIANDFSVTGIDLGPGESVTITVHQEKPSNDAISVLEAILAAPSGGSVAALDTAPHTGTCSFFPPEQGCLNPY